MQLKDNILVLEACKYEDLAKYTRVISDESLNYFMWIKLDADLIRDCALYESHELDGKERVWLPTRFRLEGIWLKASTDLVNHEPGQHIYRFTFVNRFTDVTFSLYVSYIMQTERFKKPYLYMDKCHCVPSQPDQLGDRVPFLSDDTSASSSSPRPTSFTEYQPTGSLTEYEEPSDDSTSDSSSDTTNNSEGS